MSHHVIVNASFFLLVCCLGVRVIRHLPLKKTWKWLIFLVFVISAENFFIHTLIWRLGYLDDVPKWFSLGLSVAQAYVIILALLALGRELLFLICFGAGRMWRRKLPAPALSLWVRHMGWSSAALCILALMISGKGVYNALQIPRVVEVEISSPYIPSALDGFKIAQLSDLHIGSGFDAPWLREVVKRTNALKPDMIVLTGDMLDGRAMSMQNELAPLNGLDAPYGVFVIDGNHEYYISYSDWLRYMDTVSRHRLLRNQGAVLPVNGVRLGIAGVTDIQGDKNWVGPELDAAAAAVAGADYRILLWHRPNQAEQAAMAGFDLMLSGHTHGGQFFPGNLFTALVHRYAVGKYDVDGMALYVNPGSSLWGRVPLRLGVQSEITLLTLRAEAGKEQ